MQAEIITIGDEILIGQIVDTNSAWIAQELNRVGIALKQISSVGDNSEAIKTALKEAADRADLILITGGLGPTKDDVTKHALASYFNTGMHRDEAVLAHVRSIFSRMKRPMLESNNRQADVLDNALVLHNETGTAPGMWIEQEGKYYVTMPGVPAEMMYLMEHSVLPRLRHLPDRHAIVHQSLLTAGIGESFLAEKLIAIEDQIPPHIHLAYLPSYGQVRLRLSAEGENGELLIEEETSILKRIAEHVKEYVVAYGDTTLEKEVLKILQKNNCTLAVAESCSGGYLAHRFTSIPGCSTVFLGGAVAYSNKLKKQMLAVKESTLCAYGAVSEETVIEMALGAKKSYDADYAVAISGIAGPDGGTDDKPVGTVWISVAGKTKHWAGRFQLGKVRTQVIERSAALAIQHLYRLLREEIVK